MLQHTAETTPNPIDDLSLDELEAMMASFDDEIIEMPIPDDDILEADSVIEVIDAAPLETLELEAAPEDDIALLANIEEEIVAEEVAIEESILTSAIKAIKAEERAQEIYAEQEAEETIKPVKEKAPRPVKTVGDRETILAAKAKPNFYLLETSDLELDEAGQQAKHVEILNMIKGMNVKVGAKCIDLLAAANGKGKMSTFIESGIRYILNEATISNADMIDYFMKMSRNGVKSYEKSTATPQATNLLKLFSLLKVLDKTGSTYTLNNDSLLLALFRNEA